MPENDVSLPQTETGVASGEELLVILDGSKGVAVTMRPDAVVS